MQGATFLSPQVRSPPTTIMKKMFAFTWTCRQHHEKTERQIDRPGSRSQIAEPDLSGGQNNHARFNTTLSNTKTVLVFSEKHGADRSSAPSVYTPHVLLLVT